MIQNIQYLRGTAALAVVLYHMHVWEGKVMGAEGVVPSYMSIGDAGVDLFFVISGFIMVYIQPQRLNTRFSYFNFLAHRFTRVFPSYWLVLTALVPIWLARPSFFNNYYDNHVDIVRSFLLLPQDYTPLLAVGWTLIHEVYFYVVVSFALSFGMKGRAIFGMSWFTIVLVVFMIYGHTNFGDVRVLQLIFSPFSLTFLLGYFLGLFQPKLKTLSWWGLWAMVSMGLVGLYLGFTHIKLNGVYPDNNHLLRVISFGLPGFLMVMGFVGIEQKLSKKSKAPGLAKLGDASYALYLVHLPIVAFTYALVRGFHVRGTISLYSIAIGCLALCLVSAFAFHIYIEKRILKVSRKLIERYLKPSVSI